MPLTRSGKSILKSFQNRYGTKTGRGFFYAKTRSSPKQTAKWHKGGKR